MEQFSAGPVDKVVPSFRNSLTRICEGDGKHAEHFSLFRISVHTYNVCAFLNS